MTKTDSEISREQRVSRSAIYERRRSGWTQEEIEAGERDTPRKENYDTEIADYFGMPVKEVAEKEGVTVNEVYRRYHEIQAGNLKYINWWEQRKI